MKIVLMASGNGSNAQSIIEFAQSREDLEVQCLVTDKPQAYVIERMKKFSIPVLVIPKENKSREEHEKSIIAALNEFEFHWICLAGYMRVFTKSFLSQFWDSKQQLYRIINIHPSALPSFPGIRAYEQAFAAGVSESGVTVHLVDEGVDTGAIILQEKFKRIKTDTFEEFKQRGLSLEHNLYKKALDKIIKEYQWD